MRSDTEIRSRSDMEQVEDETHKSLLQLPPSKKRSLKYIYFNMHWKLTTVLICIYGIVKEFRPATPFLTPYLISSYKNFTDVQLYSQIYPFWTYSYLVALIPVFFLTDITRYKPVIMLEAASLCVTWGLLVWGHTLIQMQLMQVAFGVASAAEIAYYSYMYAVVDQNHYKQITSYIRAAALVGKFLAFGLAQFLVSTNLGSYLLLNQISFGAVATVFVVAVALPPIRSKIIANQVRSKSDDGRIQAYSVDKEYEEQAEAHGEEMTALDAEPPNVDNGISAYFRAVWHHFKVFKTNTIVFKWSLWWALTSCGMFQVYNYVQTLWAEMQSSSLDTMNGVAECVNTLIGALISFLVQYIRLDWLNRGELILFVSSSFIAALLFVMSGIRNIFISYVLYVLINSIYLMLITAASANIASQLDSASYALVFGWNTFVALGLQTLLTLAVADEHGFNLDIRSQFVVYGGYFGVVSLIFLLILIAKSVSLFGMRPVPSRGPPPLASSSSATREDIVST